MQQKLGIFSQNLPKHPKSLTTLVRATKGNILKLLLKNNARYVEPPDYTIIYIYSFGYEITSILNKRNKRNISLASKKLNMLVQGF